MVGGLNEQFQTDLVDMQSLAKLNDGYKYILTCIDILSKYAWAIPLKKKAESIVEVFKKIFAERTPHYLQSDAGKATLYKQILQKICQVSRNECYWTLSSDSPTRSCLSVKVGSDWFLSGHVVKPLLSTKSAERAYKKLPYQLA
ncbi:lrr and pyd domains-containing protein 3-like protein [Lasius niger]|uniref:Lrr and pyd domains-containing protein 3-like protein n=1 Tax=Lasius niger TaxID=67767 RepID=A0A0J7JYD4_LASNI|nr:lrr and pyd domains-containing protein 3-like protein [Lasius niger]